MCNISDKRDTVRMFENSYFPGQNYNNTSINMNFEEGSMQIDSKKQSDEETNSFLKKVTDIAAENKNTSVVKSSKVGGATHKEETAHFVFFDMED